MAVSYGTLSACTAASCATHAAQPVTRARPYSAACDGTPLAEFGWQIAWDFRRGDRRNTCCTPSRASRGPPPATWSPDSPPLAASSPPRCATPQTSPQAPRPAMHGARHQRRGVGHMLTTTCVATHQGMLRPIATGWTMDTMQDMPLPSTSSTIYTSICITCGCK